MPALLPLAQTYADKIAKADAAFYRGIAAAVAAVLILLCGIAFEVVRSRRAKRAAASSESAETRHGE